MKETFDMSDLGVEVCQDASSITLRQTHYAKHILELSGMAGCNPAHTPMEKLRLSRHNTAEEVDSTHYRRLVGSLRYLVHTRSDLAFAVGFVSRFMERPTTEHLQAVKPWQNGRCGGAEGGQQVCSSSGQESSLP
ncbi:uncharacterized mitochondrial protein AtMg00810-like [Miscanthus floridulus]|uniref:uncharacterized mitochondrial protein AtMg00810-like n=1 Tax=Miscanthus floridulus TaxID=154761 RepID=UPI003457A961